MIICIKFTGRWVTFRGSNWEMVWSAPCGSILRNAVSPQLPSMGGAAVGLNVLFVSIWAFPVLLINMPHCGSSSVKISLAFFARNKVAKTHYTQARFHCMCNLKMSIFRGAENTRAMNQVIRKPHRFSLRLRTKTIICPTLKNSILACTWTGVHMMLTVH